MTDLAEATRLAQQRIQAALDNWQADDVQGLANLVIADAESEGGDYTYYQRMAIAAPALARAFLALAQAQAEPIDMLIECPRCHAPHVDAPEPEIGWTNPPHKSHLCHNCRLVFRRCDRPTNGVAAIKSTKDVWSRHAETPVTDAEVAEVRKRHENYNYNFPELRHVDYTSSSAVAQIAHRDRGLLLRRLEQVEAKLTEFTNNWAHDLAQDLVAAGEAESHIATGDVSLRNPRHKAYYRRDGAK